MWGADDTLVTRRTALGVALLGVQQREGAERTQTAHRLPNTDSSLFSLRRR